MRIQEIVKLLGPTWSSNAPIRDVSEFAPTEALLRNRLPADYKYFLMWSNGGEALPPLPRFTLYPLEELIPRREYGHPPDVVEFATDDSTGFGFDLSKGKDSASYPVVAYPLGSLDRIELERRHDEFSALLLEILAPRMSTP